eukprot:scaffold650349_cov45-Prasinocladus_malaysianus.AAC.1
MVIGVTVFAYFMGNTASLIAAMNSSETVVQRKLAQVRPLEPKLRDVNPDLFIGRYIADGT